MPKNVPTIRRGREVAGTGGIGKVQLIYKPKKPKPYGLMFLGFIVYSIFIGIYFTSFFWSRPQTRGHIIIPIWKKLLFGGDSLRILWNQWRNKERNLGKSPSDIYLIETATEEAALYHQGYIHAKERLFQLEVHRRMAWGTLTEMFGNKTLHLDTLSCTLDFKSHAHKTLEQLSNDTILPLLTAYSRGVNDAIAREFQGMFPLDFYYTYGLFGSIRIDPWQPVHSIAILHWMAYQHSHGWEDDLISTLLKKQLDPDSFEELFGDEQHVLDSSFSSHHSTVDSILQVETVGSSIFAKSNPNGIVFGTDFIGSVKNLGFWYPNQLKSRTGGVDNLEVQGLSFPGLPFVLLGSTAEVSWSIALQPLRQQQRRDVLTLITDADHKSGEIFLTRKEYIPLRESTVSSSTNGNEEYSLLEVEVLESSSFGIDVYPLLAPEVKAACINAGFKHVFLKSELFAVGSSAQKSPFVAKLLRFFHQMNHVHSAADVQKLVSSSDFPAVPWHIVYADASGTLGVLPAPKEDQIHSSSTQEVKAIVAGPNSHLRKALYRSLSNSSFVFGETVASSIFDQVFSPAGWTLAQQLAHLLRQQPLVMKFMAEGSRSSNDLSTYEQYRQRDFLEIITLFESFDGQYTTEAIAPSIIEAFRINFLVEIVHGPANALATTLLGGYNITAVSRLTEMDVRSDVSRLLAPYVHQHCTLLSDSAASSSACASSSGKLPHETHKRTSSWVEQAGGIDAVVYRSMDAALDWLYKTNEQRPLSTWQWQNHHQLLVHHPVSPVILLDL